jgi:hypothetical protein
MPSMKTSVWFASEPRTRTSAVPPAPRFTATPGTSRSTSTMKRVWRLCSASSSSTVTDEPSRSAGIGSPERVARTTMASAPASPASVSSAAANAGDAAAMASSETYRIFLIVTSLAPEQGRQGVPTQTRPADAGWRTNGRPFASRRRRVPRCQGPCGPGRMGSSLRRKTTVPWPYPGPRQERPNAGRSPGSRVRARCAPSQADGPVAALPLRKERMRIALAAYSCRDSCGIGRQNRPHRIPFSALPGTGAICGTKGCPHARGAAHRPAARGCQCRL